MLQCSGHRAAWRRAAIRLMIQWLHSLMSRSVEGNRRSRQPLFCNTRMDTARVTGQSTHTCWLLASWLCCGRLCCQISHSNVSCASLVANHNGSCAVVCQQVSDRSLVWNTDLMETLELENLLINAAITMHSAEQRKVRHQCHHAAGFYCCPCQHSRFDRQVLGGMWW